MATCEECGAPLVDDRGCSYCDGTYCGAHQLPEHHDCPAVRGSEEVGPGGDGDGVGNGGERGDGSGTGDRTDGDERGGDGEGDGGDGDGSDPGHGHRG